MVPKQRLNGRDVDLVRAELVSKPNKVANVVVEGVWMGITVVVGDIVADGCG